MLSASNFISRMSELALRDTLVLTAEVLAGPDGEVVDAAGQQLAGAARVRGFAREEADGFAVQSCRSRRAAARKVGEYLPPRLLDAREASCMEGVDHLEFIADFSQR